MATLKKSVKTTTAAPAPRTVATAEARPCGIVIEPNALYTVADAADLLRVADKTVRRWMSPDDSGRRRLRCRRLGEEGSTVYIWGHQLIAFLEPDGDAEETETGLGS